MKLLIKSRKGFRTSFMARIRLGQQLKELRCAQFGHSHPVRSGGAKVCSVCGETLDYKTVKNVR